MTASTGTLIAAALETVGYRAQAEVLSSLGGMVTQLGALVFLAAVLCVIASYAITGNSSFGKWIIIAPGVFYFLLFTPVHSIGAEWQFGSEKSSRADRKSNSDDLNSMVGGEKKVVVSWAFDRYNQLVSFLSREVISVITGRKSVIKEIKFTARQRALDGLMASDLDDGGLKALVEVGLKGECSEAMEIMRVLAYGRRDPKFRTTQDYKDAARRVEDAFIKKNFTLSPQSPEYSFLTNHLRAVKVEGKMKEKLDQFCEGEHYQDLYQDFDILPDKDPAELDFFERITQVISEWFGSGSEEAEALQNFSPEQLIARGINCQRLWCWTMIALDSEARAIQSQIGSTVIPQRASDELKTEIWKEVSEKLKDPYIKTSAREDTSLLPIVISGVLLRKAFNSDPKSNILSTFAKNAEYKITEENLNMENWADNTHHILRFRNQHGQAEAQRYEIFSLAMNLPYIQGLGLYFLALTYPFFCMLVLVPGKASGVLNWMALWAWVKSWDIGWAVAMVVDDTLWKIFPHRSYHNIMEDFQHGPLTVLEAAFRPDPAYSLAAYYMIMGTAIAAIPIYSGHMVLGAKRGILGAMMGGVTRLSQQMGVIAAFQSQSEMSSNSSQLFREYTGYSKTKEAIESGAMPPEFKAELDKANEDTNWQASAWGYAGAGVMGVGKAISWIGQEQNPNPGGLPNYGPSGLMTRGINLLMAPVRMAGRGLTTVGESWMRPTVELAQTASAYKRSLFQMNMNYQMYRAYRSEEMRFAQAIYTGDTGRGDYFFQPAPQQDTIAEFHTLKSYYAARGAQATTQFYSGTVRGGIETTVGVVSALPATRVARGGISGALNKVAGWLGF